MKKINLIARGLMWVALGGLAACGKSPPAHTPTSAAPVIAGDRLAFRFVDHVDQAIWSGPALSTAWQSMPESPQHALLPYASSAGETAYRAVQIAFADKDIEDYGLTDLPGPRHPVNRLDPVWNRTRAVYLSRQALYLPAGAAETFQVPRPRQGRLETAVGAVLPPRATPLTLNIMVDEKVCTQVTIAPQQSETWLPLSCDLDPTATSKTATITFRAQGLSGHAFFANPLLWAKNDGRAGRNVLVIVVDTLRADALAVMPRLAAYAEQGARFDQAITAATWTRPALLALYGGDLASAVGQTAEIMIPDEITRRAFYRLAPPLLPRLLSNHGWRASAIGNNFFLLGYPRIGLDMGFEEVDDVRHPVLDTPAIARSARRFFEENKAHAWFLHLHFDAPHWPYTAPKKYAARVRSTPLAGRYQDPLWIDYLAEAAYADEYVGEVLDALAASGLAEQTLVVILGDHGEVFDPVHAHRVEALGLDTIHHHGWAAYDEVTHVPLVAVLPKAIPPRLIAAPVRTLDISATVLDYLGLPLSLLPKRGQTLRPLIEGRETSARESLTEGQNIRALRSGGFTYLVRSDGRLLVKQRSLLRLEELYDLQRDPAQHHNLLDEASPETAALAAGLRAKLASLAPLPPATPLPVYHLQLAQDSRPHRLEVTLATKGKIALRTLKQATASPLPEQNGALHLELTSPGSVEFTVDPPEAALDLTLILDTLPLPLERVLAGQFALPLIDGPLEGGRLVRLDARQAPLNGQQGEVMLWREAGASRWLPSELPREPVAGQLDEVGRMMQRWGYTQSK